MFLAFRVTIDPPADSAPVTSTTTPPAANQPPVVKLGGKKKVTTSKDTFKVHGSAHDGDGSVRKVEVKVNKGPYRKAKGGAKWSFDAELKPGKNIILVRTTDAAGAVSAPVKLIVFRK